MSPSRKINFETIGVPLKDTVRTTERGCKIDRNSSPSDEDVGASFEFLRDVNNWCPVGGCLHWLKALHFHSKLA